MYARPPDLAVSARAVPDDHDCGLGGAAGVAGVAGAAGVAGEGSAAVPTMAAFCFLPMV
jgi:hypothetical protein